MTHCDCGNPPTAHHPSLHYAEKRDAVMSKVEEFMEAVYPAHVFGDTFNRQQVALIAACFVIDGEASDV
jgi:hypothetical protein